MVFGKLQILCHDAFLSSSAQLLAVYFSSVKETLVSCSGRTTDEGCGALVRHQSAGHLLDDVPCRHARIMRIANRFANDQIVRSSADRLLWGQHTLLVIP